MDSLCEIYVALLRGINVGGNNKIDMKQLKKLFEDGGLMEVKTYLNSGNVIFSFRKTKEEILAKKLEKLIREKFGFDIAVLVVNRKNFLKVAAKIPPEAQNDSEQRCDVFFFWPEVNFAQLMMTIGKLAETEQLIDAGRAAIWMTDRVHYSQSKVPKITGSALYRRLTIRNCNTVRKLEAMLAP